MRNSIATRRHAALAAVAALGLSALAVSCGGDESSGNSGPFAGAGGAPEGGDGPDAAAGGTAGGLTGGTGGTGPDASMGGMPPMGGSAGMDVGGAGGVDAGGPSSTCGNSVTEPPEQCDDGNQTPDDGCENDCRFTCTNNGHCSDGVFCNGSEICNSDHTCSAGTVIPDDVYCGQNSVCRNGACIRPDVVCGDGLIIAPENCEDGVTLGDTAGVDGDGCDTDCKYSCSNQLGGKPCVAGDECEGTPVCNDAIHMCVAGTPLADYTPCTVGQNAVCINQVCTTEYCSNGSVETPEECDDSNLAPGDGCEPDCTWTCTDVDDSNCNPPDECRVSGGCDTTDSTAPVCNAPVILSDGTSCNAGADFCINGVCRPPLCGDGLVNPGEECDDQNQATGDGCTPDCQWECKSPVDCGQPPPCMDWACTNHVCVAAPAFEGSTCGPGPDGGAPTCTGGTCTSGTCGGLDSTVDPGEECEHGGFNGQPGTGCTINCRFQCHSDEDCSGGDPCSGRTCEPVLSGGDSGSVVGQECRGQTAPDGQACGTGRICVNGGCQVGFCGDGFVDDAQGEQCDPPGPDCDVACQAQVTCDMSGVWAMKMDIDVTWPQVLNPTGPGIILVAGSGTVEAWVRVDITQASPSSPSLGLSISPCGLAIPDFKSGDQATFPDEWWGLAIPNSVFDSGDITPAATTGIGNSPGSAFTAAPTAMQIGLSMTNPFGPWPLLQAGAIPGATLVDVEPDTFPGMTATPKQGAVPQDPGFDYQDIVVYPFGTVERADQLYLAIRQISSLSGTVDSCDVVSGDADVTAINNHILGCHVGTTGIACDGVRATLVDGARPIYTATGATFQMTRMIPPPGNPDCGDIRAAFP